MCKGKECHNCGNKYTAIGSHWRADGNSCEYIEINEHQMEILTGVLMGDGNVQLNNGENPLLKVAVKEWEYLKCLKSELGVIANSVKSANKDEMWVLRTMRHPQLHDLLSWYDSGEKVWDESTQFTSTVLKHLYACDGSLCGTDESRGYCHISICNEKERANKIADRLEKEVPRPTVDKYGENCALRWSVDESEEVLNYMGKPLSGYEYKWNMGE